MANENKSVAQAVYEQVEEMKSGGMSNADAVRQVAEQQGKSINAVRANIHQHRQRAGIASTGRRGRGRKPQEVTVESALGQAKALLQQALDGIDREVDTAKADLDAAQARYDELVESIAERKQDLENKIKALS